MRVLLSLIVLTLLVVETGSAQRRGPRPGDFMNRPAAGVEFGVRGGYDFDVEVGSAGAQLRIPLIPQLLLVPSGDVFFNDDGIGADWQINVDALVRPDEFGGLYAGIGAAFAQADYQADGDTEVEAGYNLLAGIEAGRILRTRVRPFVEARWTSVNDFDPFRLVVGINAPVR